MTKPQPKGKTATAKDAAPEPTPPPDSDAVDAAFDAARARVREPAPDATPAAGGPDERTRNRWRTRNARRRARGKAELSDAENAAIDAQAGLAPEEAPASAGPGATAVVQGPARTGRMTRDDLEREVAKLRQRVAGIDDDDLRGAIGTTAGMAWDIIRQFTPNADRALSSTEREQLGRVWAPVLAPRLEAVAHAMPIVAAIAGTYQVLAPRVMEAVVPGAEPVRVVDAREVDASRGNESRPIAPARDGARAATEGPAEATPAEPVEVPPSLGYTPVEDFPDA